MHSAPHTGGQAALLFCCGRENITSDDIHPPTRLVALFFSLLLFVVSLTAGGIVSYIHPADVPTEASQPGAGEGHAPARVRGTLPYHQVRHAAMRYNQGLLANHIIYSVHRSSPPTATTTVTTLLSSYCVPVSLVPFLLSILLLANLLSLAARLSSLPGVACCFSFSLVCQHRLSNYLSRLHYTHTVNPFPFNA